MPNVYLPGTILPASQGAVRGGLAVELHAPDEIDGLIALCELVPRPPEDPMTSVYRALGDPSLDLAAWATYWRDHKMLHPAVPPRTTEATLSDKDVEELLPVGQLGKLLLALSVAKDLWVADVSEMSLLTLVVLLAEPTHTGKSELNLDGNRAALVIQPGSLVGDVVRLPLHVTTFAVCFIAGGGTSTSARRGEMVARLRESALNHGARSLTDIRELASRPPGDKPTRPLAVLVHGLFATDVGTFDALQSRLEKQFDVVGYPHDTLSESIEANGFELSRILALLEYPKMCCVAHSRGGLVARSAAVQLAKATNNDRVIARCATFGTPHLGAEMAENPGSLIATIVFLKAGLADKSLASVIDMGCAVVELGSYPGIVDLRPPSTNAAWLSKLQSEEGLHPDAKMPIFAVGGAKRPSGLMQHIAGFTSSRIIGRKPNDLIVAQSSSLPLFSNPKSMRQSVTCNHFSYFKEDQAQTLDQVVEFLRAS